MERIVLGYDGTPAAGAALSWVADRASRDTVAVTLLNAVSRFAPDRAAALQQLSAAESVLRERAPGTVVELHRLDDGVADPSDGFTADADLVVVGIDPGRPIRADLAGALPRRIDTRAQTPVVVVPTGWAGSDEPYTVGLADDGSSAAALAWAAREAEDAGGALRLVHAWLMPTPSFSGTAVLAEAHHEVMREHAAILTRALERVVQQHPSLRIESELVRDSRAAALLRFAPRSSLIAIGSRHRGTALGSLLGSVAEGVLWRAECPVVIVPHGAVRTFEKEH